MTVRPLFIATAVFAALACGPALAAAQPSGARGLDLGGLAGRWVAILSESSPSLSLGPTLEIKITGPEVRLDMNVGGSRGQWRCSVEESECSNRVKLTAPDPTTSTLRATKSGLRITTATTGLKIGRSVVRDLEIDQRGRLVVRTKDSHGPALITIYMRVGTNRSQVK